MTRFSIGMLAVGLLFPALVLAGDRDIAEGLAERMTREALAAGAAGDVELRSDLLQRAVRVAPQYAPARWAQGQIEHQGEWQPVSYIQQAASSDVRLAEYDDLRRGNDGSVEGHLRVARWCRGNELADEARYHYLAVLNEDRENREALAVLDRDWLGGELVPSSAAEAARQQAREARRTRSEWNTRITGWLRQVGHGGAQADQALGEIEAEVDETAIESFERLAMNRRGRSVVQAEREQQLCLAFISALDRLPSYEASVSLCRIGVLSDDELLQTRAVSTLEDRPTDEVMPILIAGLMPVLETEFSIIRDSEGRVSYSHEIYSAGSDADYLMRASTSVSTPVVVLNGSTDADIRRAAQQANENAFASWRRMWAQAARVEQAAASTNQVRQQLNGRIVAVLQQVTGQQLGNQPQEWWDYWQEYSGYQLDRELVTSYDTQDYYRPSIASPPPPTPRCECFAAGTLVWTKTGLEPIETLRSGDQVLAMDVATGERCFRPVLQTTRRPPSELMRIATSGYQLVCTPGHPFWVEGRGWRMGKELAVGDRITTAEGMPVQVEALVTPGEAQEAFNLVVDEHHNYFVGQEGLLSHDNVPRRPQLARAGTP